MGGPVKKGSQKLFAFDTYKNNFGLTDLTMRLINPATGVVVAGTETLMNEVKVDPAILAIKKAAITADVLTGSTVFTVSVVDAAKFGIKDIVEVKTTGGTGTAVVVPTTIKSINYTTGAIELNTPASADAAIVADTPELQLVDATGSYQGTMTIPTTTGTYLIWISSEKVGEDYNYGMVEVVDNDLADVMTEITNIKVAIAGGGAVSFGRLLQ